MMRPAKIQGADNAIDDACHERVISLRCAAERCHGFALTVTIRKLEEPPWLRLGLHFQGNVLRLPAPMKGIDHDLAVMPCSSTTRAHLAMRVVSFLGGPAVQSIEARAFLGLPEFDLRGLSRNDKRSREDFPVTLDVFQPRRERRSSGSQHDSAIAHIGGLDDSSPTAGHLHSVARFQPVKGCLLKPLLHLPEQLASQRRRPAFQQPLEPFVRLSDCP